MRKKAQSWYLDYIIGLLIFSLGLFLFLQYSPNFDKSTIADTMLDADIISDTILSEGVPSDWTSSNFMQVGIITDFKLDINKLKELNSMNYDDVRGSLPIGSDFYMEFEKGEIDLGSENFVSFGKTGANSTNIKEMFDPVNMVNLKRMMAYSGEIIILDIYVWTE